MRRPPKYCQGFVDRHGTARWYFRRPGFKRVPLPGLPWSPEFMSAYEMALQGALEPKRVQAGTIDALIASYYRSPEYLNLRPVTQRNYRSTIELFRAEHGGKRVTTLQREHIKAIIAKKADRPGVANGWLKMIRILMRHAVDAGQRRDDPTIGIKSLRTGSTGYRTWTEAEIEQFYQRHPEGSRARLALDLMLFTGQRREDVIHMGRQHIRDCFLCIRQSKTGSEVEIPLPAKILDAVAGQMTFLLTEYGKPFTSGGFGNWFRDRIGEADLPSGLSPHGLRKAACRRLAEAGCTAPQIMAISGHKNLKEVQTYIAAADRKRLAGQAMDSLKPRTESVKPDGPV